jgi:flagellin-like hook-associated protein FlgL
MMSFKEFCVRELDEDLVTKGAVTAYAINGKRHGDRAVKSYRRAQTLLGLASKEKTSDRKLDQLAAALSTALDGMIKTRSQLGAISAQVTASIITNRS